MLIREAAPILLGAQGPPLHPSVSLGVPHAVIRQARASRAHHIPLSKVASSRGFYESTRTQRNEC